MISSPLPVAVIGAGPIGLAAAAHLLERGQTPIVFEAGAAIGTNILDWGHVRMFSPWRYTVDGATVRRLEAHGWSMPPEDDLPTGRELVEKYLLPFAQLPGVREHIALNARVVAVTRLGIDKMKDRGREEAPFVLHVVYGDGRESRVEARAVIDASGTWHQPNPIGAGGLPAVGEKRHADRIFYGIPDATGLHKTRYAGKRILVVGSGHSAVNALLDLANLRRDYPETTILWAMRGTNLARVYGGGGGDALPARGRLGTRIQAHVRAGAIHILSPFHVRELAADDEGVRVVGETAEGARSVAVDEIVAATGARPEIEILRELRLEIDPSLESPRQLAPMIDPNIHSCGTVRPHGEAELRHPEKDFYIVGMKSYGRAPTFLLATGYEQVRSVVAALAGDWDAARNVQLNLPETGVCSSDLGDEGGACCGAPIRQEALLSLSAIPVKGISVQPALLRTVEVQSPGLRATASDCGCDDACCSDGERSTDCGCEPSCCS